MKKLLLFLILPFILYSCSTDEPTIEEDTFNESEYIEDTDSNEETVDNFTFIFNKDYNSLEWNDVALTITSNKEIWHYCFISIYWEVYNIDTEEYTDRLDDITYNSYYGSHYPTKELIFSYGDFYSCCSKIPFELLDKVIVTLVTDGDDGYKKTNKVTLYDKGIKKINPYFRKFFM